MYHSITFGDKNTWDDWRLIPSSRPLFNPPSVKTSYVEIPGGNGSIDLTEALNGEVNYNNRTGTFEFYVDNDFKPWQEMYSELMAYLHGRRLIAILEDDPSYCYEGRFSINGWRSDKDRSSVTIGYNVGPFKKPRDADSDDWLWDTFNFETGYVTFKNLLTVNGTLTTNIDGDRNFVSPPTFVCTSAMTVTFNGATYALHKGANTPVGLILQNGKNSLTFKGNGTVTIRYRGGLL